jgi:hypothetical protein
MSGKKPDSDELLHWIGKLSSEADWSVQETREALSEAGIRPDDVANRVLQLVTRLKKESPFHWKAKAHAMRGELLEKVRTKVGAEVAGLARPELLRRLKEAIHQLPAPLGAKYAVAFRKFEDATEQDLRSMLEEVAVIEDLDRDEG